ncbi:MAG: LysR family transcriptional regulator [Pseudomonadota bacterium]
MNPTLRQLRAFSALAKTGSFTLAADYLHVTQAALSGLIKELEATLGVRLVDRSTRKVALTEFGRELVPLFSKLIDDLDGALQDISNHTKLRAGTVRVAAPQLMSCTLLPQVIAAYRAAYPEIQVRLVDCAVENVSARVASGEVDLGIGPERDTGSEVRAALLFEMPFVLVFPTGHPLGQRAQARWSDLADYPFISLAGQFTERLLSDMHGSLRDVPLNPANEVTFMTTALAMVSAGLGVTVCLPYAAPLVHLYQLQMRPLVEPELTRRFFVYTRDKRSMTPAADSFISFLNHSIEALPAYN